MATAKNILIIFLLGYFCRAEKTVFLSDKLASGVLVRQKRYNSGAFEEFAGGNLERECLEEKCTYEEAREVFENDDKTSEFWKQYVDGDQCISNPCLNEGVCKDDVSSYVCWCARGYRGKNCEFELPVTCTINNGGCQQMCMEDAYKKVTCSCVSGYKLGADGQTCEEMVQYPCGRVSAPEAVPKEETRTILDLEDNANNSSSTEHHNSTENIHLDDHSDDIVPVTVDPNVRIVGGTDSLKGEFPWQVYNFFKKGVKRVKMVYKMQPDNNNHSIHLNPTVHLALPSSQCAAVQECLCCSSIDKGATLSQEVCYWPDHQV